MPAVAGPAAYAVVYDGHCAVCGKIIERVRGWDRDGVLEILASQSAGVAERFPWIDRTSFAESMHVVRTADGKTWEGAAAVERLLDVLPRGRWIAWIFHVPFARWSAERFYRWFSRNRYRMGCGRHCRTHPEQGSE